MYYQTFNEITRAATEGLVKQLFLCFESERSPRCKLLLPLSHSPAVTFILVVYFYYNHC